MEAIQEPNLFKRILRGMKHPLRASWHVLLRLKYHVKNNVRRMARGCKRFRDAFFTKTLFVGAERDCCSVAFVLGVKYYVKVEKLTVHDFGKYKKWQIYICEFKRNSTHLIDSELELFTKKFKYLDDICRMLDQEATDKRIRVKDHYEYIKPYQGDSGAKREYLRELSPAELFLYVLRTPVNEHIYCTHIEKELTINNGSKMRGCCHCMLIFGDLLQNDRLDKLYDSIYARIIKLSSLNGSYCLCDLNRCGNGVFVNDKILPTKSWDVSTIPQKIILSFDRSCNLACKSCRKEFYVMNDATQRKVAAVTDCLLKSGWLDKVNKLIIAGMGEVFYSPYYRKLLTTDLLREQVNIKSNGILFNESNWQLIANKYKKINVEISVDAATAETYRKLRGADFNILMKNLTMLGELRRRGKIKFFQLNFVVQRENFIEMPDFVRFGKKLGVDRIHFQHMDSFGHITEQELSKQCLIINDEYLDYELWKVLQDPIFNDPIVDLKGLQRYIDASEKLYRKRYEREQQVKQHQK